MGPASSPQSCGTSRALRRLRRRCAAPQSCISPAPCHRVARSRDPRETAPPAVTSRTGWLIPTGRGELASRCFYSREGPGGPAAPAPWAEPTGERRRGAGNTPPPRARSSGLQAEGARLPLARRVSARRGFRGTGRPSARAPASKPAGPRSPARPGHPHPQPQGLQVRGPARPRAAAAGRGDARAQRRPWPRRPGAAARRPGAALPRPAL